MKNLIASVLIIILSAGVLTSCKKDKGDPPVLPPQESMIIDFSNFTAPSKSGDASTVQKGSNNSNWLFAASVATFWNGVVTVTLAVPVYAFKQSIDQDPVYVDDKTWQWVYNTTLSGISYKARLTGKIRSTDVQWKMYITKSGDSGYTDFLWFEGTSLIDGTAGQWTLNESNESPVPILQIDWTKSGTAINSIKYTIVKDNVYKDSYIEYGPAADTYDSQYTVHYYNGTRLSDVIIKWNKVTHDGTVQSTDYNEGVWYCWDTNKVNVVCNP